MTKVCRNCNLMMHLREFEVRKDTGRRRNVCRKCRVLQINRWQEINREQTRENQRRYNNSLHGRAVVLLNAAKARAFKKGEKFDLNLSHIKSALRLGVCVKTGVTFEYQNSVGGSQSPYAPSVDKIDPQGVYEDANVQIVCFWYNTAKQQWSEDVMTEMCRRVIEKNND